MKHIETLNIFLKGEETRARSFENDAENGVSIKARIIDDFFVVNEIHELDGGETIEKRVQAWPVKDVVSYNMVILDNGGKVKTEEKEGKEGSPLFVLYCLVVACVLGFVLGGLL